MTSPRHWRLDCDAKDIGWLCFDRQDAGANTLSTETMAELHAVLDDLSRRRLRGLVIYSGKESGFIAGADINEFPALDSEERAFALTRQGQMILDRLRAPALPDRCRPQRLCAGRRPRAGACLHVTGWHWQATNPSSACRRCSWASTRDLAERSACRSSSVCAGPWT